MADVKILSTDILDALTDELVVFDDHRYASIGRILYNQEVRPKYDSTKSYNFGDFVFYDDGVEGSAKSFVCKDNGVTGEFDISKWVAMDYHTYLKTIYSNAVKAWKPQYETLITNSFSEELAKIESESDIEVKLEAVHNALNRIYNSLPGSAQMYGVSDYSSASSYAVGDMFAYNGVLYEATEFISAGDTDWELKSRQVEVGKDIKSAGEVRTFIESMVDTLTDSDNSVVKSNLYNYSGKLYRANETFTKTTSQKWRNLSYLDEVSLSDLVFNASEVIKVYCTQAEYEAMSPEYIASHDIIVTDTNATGKSIVICDSMTEWASIYHPGDGVLYMVPGEYKALSVLSQDEYNGLSVDEKYNGEVSLITNRGVSQFDLNTLISQRVSLVMDGLLAEIEELEKRVTALGG